MKSRKTVSAFAGPREDTLQCNLPGTYLHLQTYVLLDSIEGERGEEKLDSKVVDKCP